MIATAAAFGETPILNAPEAAEKVASGQIVLLDIRSPEEWQETGIAEGAWPVSMHTQDFPKHLQAILSQLQPEQIALICATGGRSAYIAEVLEKNGVVGVADVSEGMFGNGQSPGWAARGLPVISMDEAASRYEAIRQSWE